MKRLKSNTLGLFETKWKGTELTTFDGGYTIINSARKDHLRDVSIAMDLKRHTNRNNP